MPYSENLLIWAALGSIAMAHDVVWPRELDILPVVLKKKKKTLTGPKFAKRSNQGFNDNNNNNFQDKLITTNELYLQEAKLIILMQ